MAVLKKFRPRWWLNGRQSPEPQTSIALVPPINARYDLRPLTISQIDECWRLDQRCFVDGEAYSRDTFEYLLTAPESVSYRIVTQNSAITPEHRRRRLASCLMERIEEGFRRRDVRIVRLEVRASNVSAQKLYLSLGYSVTQRLPKYYSNGGDGLLMIKSIG